MSTTHKLFRKPTKLKTHKAIPSIQIYESQIQRNVKRFTTTKGNLPITVFGITKPSVDNRSSNPTKKAISSSDSKSKGIDSESVLFKPMLTDYQTEMHSLVNSYKTNLLNEETDKKDTSLLPSDINSYELQEYLNNKTDHEFTSIDLAANKLLANRRIFKKSNMLTDKMTKEKYMQLFKQHETFEINKNKMSLAKLVIKTKKNPKTAKTESHNFYTDFGDLAIVPTGKMKIFKGISPNCKIKATLTAIGQDLYLIGGLSANKQAEVWKMNLSFYLKREQTMD